jgi:hypothetical protein
MLSSFGDLPDLLPAEMKAFLEAVKANLREGSIQLGVEFAELLVGSVKKLKGTLQFRETASASKAKKIFIYENMLNLKRT